MHIEDNESRVAIGPVPMSSNSTANEIARFVQARLYAMLMF